MKCVNYDLYKRHESKLKIETADEISNVTKKNSAETKLDIRRLAGFPQLRKNRFFVIGSIFDNDYF